MKNLFSLSSTTPKNIREKHIWVGSETVNLTPSGFDGSNPSLPTKNKGHEMKDQPKTEIQMEKDGQLIIPFYPSRQLVLQFKERER